MNTTQGTPIAFPLRAWLAVEVLFGIGAVLAVGLAPAQTATNFAWPINPVVMAAALGAFYMTSAPLFLLPLLAKRWEMIRVMILPTALFSTIQLVTTFLHWDKFSVGSTPFYVWFASYLLPPPIFIAAHLWHQRKSKELPSTSEDQIPAWLKWILLIVGILFVLIAIVAFFIPSLLIPVFPWQLTPLTARSLSGWLAIVGVLMLSIRRDNNKTRARLASPMLILILPTILLQLSRFSNEVNWSCPTLWVGLILFAIVSLCGMYLAMGKLAGRTPVNRYFKYFILEDLDTVRRIRIGKFWGVDLFITPILWLGPFIFFGLYFLLTLLNTRLTLTERLIEASYFTLAVEIATVLHAFGHILSGKLVRNAMNGLLITATRDVNVYSGDQSQISSHVHLGRSLGGPLFNVFSAGIFFVLIQWVEPGFWMRLLSSLISVNLFFGLGGLLPIPSVDGEVIWREIRKLISSSK